MNQIFLIVNTIINNNTMLLLHERNINFSIEIKYILLYPTDYRPVIIIRSIHKKL